MRFKVRAQIIIAFIVLAVSSAFTFFHISNEKHFAQERTFRSSENVKMAFDSMIRDTERFYVFRAYANLRSDDVIQAVKENDRETLYRLILPNYKQLVEENPHLIIMQFHAANGHSILRVHLKNQFGDNIAARRPMLREVHRTHKMVTGFEGGFGGMAFRVIMPIFDQDTYIGAVEFGIHSEYFVEKIKQMTGSTCILMIHEKYLGAADKTLYTEGVGVYRYAAITDEQKKYMSLFVKDNVQMKPKNIRIQEKDYEINPLYLDDSQGNNVGMIVCTTDVTGRYQNNTETIIGSAILTLILLLVFWGVFEYTFGYLMHKLNLQERYINMVLDSQKNIVVVTDGKELIFANQAFYDYFGYSTLEKFRQDHACICDFFEPGESDEYLQAKTDGLIWTEYLTQYNTQENKVKMTVNGKCSIFTVHGQKMEYDNEIRHVVVFTDITRLNQLATHDVLTQVANRFKFDQVLDYSIALSERYGRALSMMIVDIDHFKSVNDTYGHLTGDEVLKTLAQLLSDGIRKSDVVARWGGEEFSILLPDTDLTSAAKLAESLRVKVAQHTFPTIGHITCSIGVARWNDGENSDQFLKRVDDKLYQAKENGRNLVVS